ncbi:MAG: ATP-binding protein [Burkholderiales bacterium]|nr:ATP-binding protein [Burkholderiales bacterium]
MLLRCAARWVEFETVRRHVDAFAAQSGISREDCHRLLVVTEELFVNTVRHGYAGECDRPIVVVLTADADTFALRFEDEAPAFDPLVRAPVDGLEAGAEARPLGGLGIHLTLEMTRGARYRREAERNVIELVFARST